MVSCVDGVRVLLQTLQSRGVARIFLVELRPLLTHLARWLKNSTQLYILIVAVSSISRLTERTHHCPGRQPTHRRMRPGVGPTSHEAPMEWTS